MIQPIIMAGGTGSRLWPLSRTLHPKQFLSLISPNTMLQDTVSRLDGIAHDDPIIICNEDHRFIVAEQLRAKNYRHNGIILEPIGRNTAPAVALGALHAIASGNDPILFILAADHSITDIDAFILSVNKAINEASKGNLVTFGITPTSPETGYGYIKKGKPVSDYSFTVDKFVEKPNQAIAQSYIDSGDYFWNSGLFMFKASVFLRELGRFRPDILLACQRSFDNSKKDLDFIRLDESEFRECSDESVDFAVMEHTENAVVVPLNANWNDVGSWSALWDISDKDTNGNSSRGDNLLFETSNSYVHSQSRLVAAIGLDNTIIVETKDAVLVANKNSVQEVKSVVNELKRLNRHEYIQHKEVYRPWGMHEEIANGNRYHVKYVIVQPGKKIDTQVHYHRAEHWIIVSGTAKITNGDKTFLVTENESTYIPVGALHSLENPGKIPLELIEIQSGTYLNEDDIVRFVGNGMSKEQI
ncbi:mannose-1-phosphate guanylyltransferase/mannose-6-phosphate isomerase [Obesumbacterium proteus]|uniref:mannose-1-phosphate guanylyltransferase n=1 Tax=Hafnia alvei TaxID=569 RepID=A0A172X050_HAFAL|nr:mannose-1-phosphate guanylyltransferase/mannose-6-phosphate isomerase [Obesumbacterium proteus]ANF29998.1 mannose-1-phosphate guanylyltransferase RfbM [Hafnia alvei]TBL73551.1 mannose-1-phosphate guanylyltransferase/mannose-6-phosphate isomerase [Obesumbacterium proteus]